jgi:alkane 1-monooxygenase
MTVRKLGYFSAFLIPVLVIAGYYLGGIGNLLPAFFSFILLPFIDQRLGVDPRNTAPAEGDDPYYRWVTYLWTFVQMSFIIWASFAVSSGTLANVWQWSAFVFGCSLVTGGLGITVAHELGHKKSKLEQFYAKVLLMSVGYMHFIIEHNRGHHALVATPADPATARKNETFYRFWLRSVFGGYRHAWSLEAESLTRQGHRTLSVHNQMLWFAALPLVFCFLLVVITSLYWGRWTWEVAWFFLAQSVLAFTLLELVNYVEHYGIQRKEIAPGRYERVNPLHSWNASHLLSNFFLFQLQRHSDHHVYAYKRYQVLDHYDESPQLPFGYPTMIIIAMVPPLWFHMMNARLETWQQAAFKETQA